MEKLAIQRLVRGDDGLTKVIYVDLQTLQEISDLTNYRIVNSGDLYEEPVESVDEPEKPSKREPVGPANQGRADGVSPNTKNKSGVPGNVRTPGVRPAQAPADVTSPAAIRSPESRTPAAVSPPAAAARSVSGPDMGPLGGFQTRQGSVLPDLDMSRFGTGQEMTAAVRGPQDPTSMSGNTQPSDVERALHSRNELENIKDASNPLGTRAVGTTVAGRPDTPRDTGLPAARPDLSGVGIARNAYDTQQGTPNAPTGVTGSTVNGVRPEGPDSGMPAARGPVATRDQVAGTIGGLDFGLSKPGETIGAEMGIAGAKAASLPGVSRNAYDVAYGTPTKAQAPSKQTSFPGKQKDDFEQATGFKSAGIAEFDAARPSLPGKEADDKSVGQQAVAAAKSPTTAAERTSGFASAGPVAGKPTTTRAYDAAGYSYTDRTGTAGWRNNNPGNLEASSWTRGQEGYIGASGGIPDPGGRFTRAKDGTMSRFAVFDTPENGLKAQAALMNGKYGNFTIADMMDKYAPTEYDKNGKVVGATSREYAEAMAASVGVDPDTTTFGSLSASDKATMIGAMFDNMDAARIGTSTVGLTQKGIDARDNYTGFGTGSDTPSERNAASRPSPGSSGSPFSGSGGDRGGVANSGLSGASRSTAGKTSSGASRSSGGSYGGGSSSYGGGSAGKAASGGVSGASRSTAGKGGASPSAGSGGLSGASRSTAGKTGGYSSGNTSGTTSGNGLGIGRA